MPDRWPSPPGRTKAWRADCRDCLHWPDAMVTARVRLPSLRWSRGASGCRSPPGLVGGRAWIQFRSSRLRQGGGEEDLAREQAMGECNQSKATERKPQQRAQNDSTSIARAAALQESPRDQGAQPWAIGPRAPHLQGSFSIGSFFNNRSEKPRELRFALGKLTLLLLTCLAEFRGYGYAHNRH